jgi:hypothetical protein
LIALHHLFSFVGLKNECRNQIMCSGNDDAIVSEKIEKINMNGEFGMRKGEEKRETGRLGIGETVRRTDCQILISDEPIFYNHK